MANPTVFLTPEQLDQAVAWTRHGNGGRLTYREAAAQLGVHEKWLWEAVHKHLDARRALDAPAIRRADYTVRANTLRAEIAHLRHDIARRDEAGLATAAHERLLRLQERALRKALREIAA